MKAEKHSLPSGWRMSPRSVLTYICGEENAASRTSRRNTSATSASSKIAISTIVTDRAMLLIGEPGTAKSWRLSIWPRPSREIPRSCRCKAPPAPTEEQVRYTWNYAMLIARGPSNESLIKSPIFRAMESGSIARFEEITRCAAEVQDALISILSEKRLSIPELATEIPAQRGFSIIASANTIAIAASMTCPPP